MKLLIKLSIFLSLISIYACKGQGYKAPEFNKNAFLVDARTPEEFAQGSVKGAINIPLDELENQILKFEGKDTIVVFCRSGSRAATAQDILENKGFKNVINGGSWQAVNKKLK